MKQFSLSTVMGTFALRRKKSRLGYGALAVLYLLALFLPSLYALRKARALSDTTPMELVSLAVSTNTVDVTNDDGYADLTGEVFEDLSGFQSIEFYYTSPSGDQKIESDANGDPQYINELLRFPQYSEPGVWRPTFTLIDVASNSITYTPDELAGLGFTVDITVTSSLSDLEAPELESLSFDQSSYDNSSSEFLFTGTATVTDNLSGIDQTSSYILFTSPGGEQKKYGQVSSVSGDSYIVTALFPQYAEVGRWNLQVVLSDPVGNTRTYETTDLSALTMPSELEVTGLSDTTPVSIDAFDFTASFPPIGDTIANSAKVTIFAEFSDNLSGVASVDLQYQSQTSTQIAPAIPSVVDDVWQYTVFIPVYAATGAWLPVMTTYDNAGNTQTYNHNDLQLLGYDMELNLDQAESGEVADDGIVSTDPEADGATSADPFEASVQTPVSGIVSITQVELTDPISSNDYLVFNKQYDINAPSASAEEPLILTFTIDSGSLQGQTASTVAVFRNGELVENCVTPGVTDPDPCVDGRSTLPDGDVELVVRTSEASIWFLGYQASTGPSYTFKKFFKQVKSAPALNKEKSGSTVPVKFSLGGNQGLDVLPEEVAQSQRIKCSTKAPIGEATPILVRGEDQLKFHENKYKFKWKTLKQWEGTCRQLILSFSNGETVVAYFDFR